MLAWQAVLWAVALQGWRCAAEVAAEPVESEACEETSYVQHVARSARARPTVRQEADGVHCSGQQMPSQDFWGDYSRSVADGYPERDQSYVRLLALSLSGTLTPNMVEEGDFYSKRS